MTVVCLLHSKGLGVLSDLTLPVKTEDIWDRDLQQCLHREQVRACSRRPGPPGRDISELAPCSLSAPEMPTPSGLEPEGVSELGSRSDHHVINATLGLMRPFINSFYIELQILAFVLNKT